MALSWLAVRPHARAADASNEKNMSVQNSFMTSKGCSDVVESRVEHAIIDAESRRNCSF